MPYIDHRDRFPLSEGTRLPETPGELNFVICTLIDDYLVCVKGDSEHLPYADVNEVIGVLECAKLEVYRRLAVPMEERKCRLNGDVFEAGKLAE